MEKPPQETTEPMDIPPVTIPLAWKIGETSTVHATQFILQQEDDLYYLTVGQVAPPMLIGTPEEQHEQAEEIESIPVTVLGRFVVSRKHMEQLRDLIGRMVP